MPATLRLLSSYLLRTAESGCSLLVIIILGFTPLLFSQPLEWQQCKGYYSASMQDILEFGQTYIGYSQRGVYNLTHGKTEWKYHPIINLDLFYTMINQENIVFAGSLNKVYISTDTGKSWDQYGNFPLESVQHFVYYLSSTNDYLFAGTTGGLFRCSHSTKQWSKSLGMDSIGSVDAIWTKGNMVIAHGGKGMYRSNDAGETWLPYTSDSLPAEGMISKIIEHNNQLFISYDYFKGGIFVSDDVGVTWRKQTNGLDQLSITTLWSSGADIYASDRKGTTYQLQGTTWQKVPLPQGYKILSVLPSGIYIQGTNIQRSTDNATTWQSLSIADVTVTRFEIAGNVLVSGGNYSAVFISDSTGYESKKKTANWIGASEYNQLLYWNNILFASTNTGIYKTTNLGDSWQWFDPFSEQFPPPHYYSTIPYIINYGGISAFFPDYYRSSDANKWSKMDDRPDAAVYSATSMDGSLFLLTKDGVFKRALSGNYYNVTGDLSLSRIKQISSKGKTLFATTTEGIWRSIDSAKTWQLSGLQGKNIESITYAGTIVFVNDITGHIFYSGNNGLSWKELTNNGLPASTSMHALSIFKNHCYAGIEDYGVFRLALPFASTTEALYPPNEFKTISDTINLVWESGENAVSYHVQVSLKNNFSDNFHVDRFFITDTTITLHQLQKGKTYYWRVAAIGLDGNEAVIAPSENLSHQANLFPSSNPRDNWSPTYSFSVAGSSSVDENKILHTYISTAGSNVITAAFAVCEGRGEQVLSLQTLGGEEIPVQYYILNEKQISIEVERFATGIYLLKMCCHGNCWQQLCCIVK